MGPNNDFRKQKMFSRYDQIRLEVLCATNIFLPEGITKPSVWITFKVDTTTYKTSVATPSHDPSWSNATFDIGWYRASRLELHLFHEDVLLYSVYSSVNRARIYQDISTENICIIPLRRDIAPDPADGLLSSLTLRFTELPPLETESARARFEPTLKIVLPSCSTTVSGSSNLSLRKIRSMSNISYTDKPLTRNDDYLLPEDVFNPPQDKISTILQALRGASDSDKKQLATFIEPSLVVKHGSCVSFMEAAAMHYVRQHTSIPIPRVHLCFHHKGEIYIVMDRTDGQTLSNVMDTTSESDLINLATQLGNYIKELRTLSINPSAPMGSWPCGPYDNTFFQPPPLRAFKFIEELHSYWFWRLGDWLEIDIPKTLHDTGKPYTVVLTHGDLNPTNIIVKDGQITGLVDWDTFGWYPDFWEHLGAIRGSSQSTIWLREVSKVLGGGNSISWDYRLVVDSAFYHNELWTD